jgi:probable phosphoglycerate mutase
LTFAFIRHGQTDWNRDDRLQGSSDIPLNDIGRGQAHEAAELLRAGGWQAIVSSPLERARETAEIIASDLGIELGPSYAAFVERDYGVNEGGSSSDIIAKYPDRHYPGAETLASVVTRGKAGLAQVAADFGETPTIIVCHGTIIRYTLAALAGRRLPGILNGSISTLEFEDGHWTVLSVNGVPLDQVPEPPDELPADGDTATR